jgi:hypothetical protein
MEKTWTDKNVDLGLLTTQIGNFFKEKDFNAIKGETPTGCQILAEDSPHFRLNGYVSVTIEGNPNRFTVKFEPGRKEKKFSNLPDKLTTMFIGGYFLTRRLRAEEDWMTLQKEFWRHVDNVMLYLNNSLPDSSCSPK